VDSAAGGGLKRGELRGESRDGRVGPGLATDSPLPSCDSHIIPFLQRKSRSPGALWGMASGTKSRLTRCRYIPLSCDWPA